MQSETTAHGFTSRITIRGFWANAGPGLSEHLLYAVMLSNTKERSRANDSLQSPRVYGEFRAEPERLSQAKPIQPQRFGGEVEFERALADWIIRHRAAWRHNREFVAQ